MTQNEPGYQEALVAGSPGMLLRDRSRLLLFLVVLALLALGALLRLIDITDPPLDFHPTRQLRNAIVTRGIYYRSLPNADPEMREIALAHANSMGQYEPPILENIVAATYRLTGGENLAVARIFTTLFWLVGGLALFDLARRMTDNAGALLALGFYLLLPFAVIASRSFQPDPGMVMAFILAVYFLYRWYEKPTWKWALLAGIFGGLAVLVKVVAAYLVAGAAVALVLVKTGLKGAPKNIQVWSIAGLMILPSILFYLVDNSGRASEYFSLWTLSLLHLIADPSFYVRWMSFLHSLFGLTVIVIALVGVLISTPANRALLLGLWLGYGAYGLTLPYQMYTHNYYHLQLIPIIALSLAPVAQLLVAQVRRTSKIWQAVFVLLALVSAAYPSWVARSELLRDDYRSEPAYWQEIASALPLDGSIVALTQDYGYRLMYFGWRKVKLWPITGEQELAELRGRDTNFEERFARHTEGRDYFVVTAFGQYNRQPELRGMLEANYPVIAEGDGYIIYDLRNPLNASP